MKWWFHRDPDKPTATEVAQSAARVEEADAAVRDARDTNQRVQKLTRAVQSSLRELESHRRDNHILDAMMDTLGRHQ